MFWPLEPGKYTGYCKENKAGTITIHCWKSACYSRELRRACISLLNLVIFPAMAGSKCVYHSVQYIYLKGGGWFNSKQQLSCILLYLSRLSLLKLVMFPAMAGNITNHANAFTTVYICIHKGGEGGKQPL